MSYLFGLDGRKYKVGNISFVENIVRLKQKSGSNPWPVIEACFNFWAEQKPMRYRSFIVSIGDTRQALRDSRFATTPEETYRRTLDIPEEVMLMIRCVYNVDELPMDKAFFTEFWQRFPKFRVAEKR